MKLTKITLLICILFAGRIAAQEIKEKLPPSIQTNAEGVVMVKPDRAYIDIGVTTQADTSQTAVAQNAQKLEVTLAKLRQTLGNNAEIKTISYTLQPNYRYPGNGGEPTITGYTATNIVRVTVDDLTRIGQVIDAAAGAGANRVHSLQFTLKDERVVQAQALREAALKAKAKAEALAAALGLKIVRVLSVSENSPDVIPVRSTAFVRNEAASTPIEPGTIEIRSTVSYLVEISP